MSEILQLTAQLADEAKAAGNPELAGEVLSMVIRVADLLPGMVQAASADVSALKAVADLSKTAAQIAQTVADTAKDANSRDLAQQTVTVAGKVKTVTEQVALAAQDILATSADEKEVGAATALIEEIRTIDAIVQSAVNTAKETGFSDTSPQFGTADHSRFGDAPQDEPIADSKPASPN
ncbi:MAG: hypothetical protein R2941_20160 [Desulfobacterales bacterium]